MPSVGSAYVNIRVNTKSFTTSLEGVMARLSKQMEAAGASLGKDFERGLKKTNFDASFKPLTDASGKAKTKVDNDFDAMGDSADNAADQIHRAMSGAAGSFGPLSDATKSLSGDLKDLDRSARGADRSVSRAGRGGGGGAGFRAAAGAAGFFNRQLDDIARMAPRAQATLAGLYNTAAFGGTALAGLVGGLSAAAQGIFAVGANAAAAAPALAVFANGLIGVAQLGGTLGLAFKGVGEAIGAGLEPATGAAASAGKATEGVGKAAAAAGRAVRDAKDALQDAYRDAARAAEDAARRTIRAEQALADAQRETLVAQRALNAARKEGMEQLEDIAFAAEDAALAERRASLELEDAYAALQEVSALPADSRAREEAQLSFEEAELNLRQAKDAREDANREQRDAAKKGVEGSEAMLDARNALADAQEREADAARDLADARRDEARVAEDNADRIAEAQQAVADAQRGVGDAMRASTPATTAAAAAVDKFAEAMKDLSPAQREFVNRIIGLRDGFIEARKEIAQPLFVGLNNALTTLLQGNLLGQVKDQLVVTSGVMGNFAEKAATMAESGPFKTAFINVLQENNRTMPIFGDTLLNIAQAFVEVADAAGPTLRRFALWTRRVTGAWTATRDGESALQSSRDRVKGYGNTIHAAANRMSEFWDLGKELWRTLRILGGAANRAANQFAWTDKKGDRKGYIPSLTASLKGFNDELKDNPNLVPNFTQALRNMNAIGGSLRTVVQPLIDLGSDPNVETAFRTISESDAFERLGDTATDALPELATLVTHLADILATLSESGSIDAFISALSTVSGWVSKILDFLIDWDTEIGGVNISGGKLLGVIGALIGTWRALKFVIGGTKFLTAGILGDIRKLWRLGPAKLFSTKTPAAPAAAAPAKVAGAGAEATESSWEGQVIRGLTAIKIAIDTCCVKLQAAMGRAGAAGAAGALGAAPLASPVGAKPPVAPRGMSPAAMAMMAPPPATTAKVGKLAAIFGKLSGVMGPVSKLMRPLSVGLRVLGAAFRFALGPIGLIALTLLPILWPLLVKLEEKTGIFSKTLDGLMWVLRKVGDLFMWLWDKAIRPLFSYIADQAKKIWGGLQDQFNAVKNILGKVGGAFQTFWDKIQDLWNWIKNNWGLLLAIITGPFGLAVRFIINNWDKIIAFIKGIPEKIGKILRGVWNVFTAGLRNAWAAVRRVWGTITAWVKGRPAQFRANLKVLWAVFSDGLSKAWRFVLNIWNKVVAWVRGRPAQFRENLAKLWDIFSDGLGKAWDWVQKKWDNIKQAVQNWPGQIGRSLEKIWNGMGEGLIQGVNWVGEKVNWLIEKINDVTDTFNGPQINVSWPKLVWTGFAQGGPVFGPGGPTSDSIPARLSRGEHVWTAREVQAMGGHRNVELLRKSVVRGELPTGGWWDTAKNVASSVTGAIGKGAAAGIKYVISQFLDELPDTFIGNFIGKMIENAADSFADWGEDKDEKMMSAGTYTGPPGGWTYPLAYRFPISQYPNAGHSPSWAVDIAAPSGTAVRAVSAGILRNLSLGNSSYGTYIIISHAGGVSSLYAHLRSQSLPSGKVVRTGQTIGYSDSTGNSTGPHLHFEVRPSSSTVAAMAAHGVKLGKGGVVAPSPQGTLAVLAEAGSHERVTPLDPEGFTPAERRIIETLESKLGGGGDQYHVHPSEKMDETRLADLVARRVKWQKRRGRGR